MFRLLSIWFQDEETIVAVFRTTFPIEFPYDPQERRFIKERAKETVTKPNCIYSTFENKIEAAFIQ